MATTNTTTDGGRTDDEQPDEDSTLTLDVTEPFVEWMELEAEEHDFDDAAEWAVTQLKVRLTDDLAMDHRVHDEMEIELPDDLAERVTLYAADLEARGQGDKLRDIIMDYVQFDHHYTADGEPIAELVADE